MAITTQGYDGVAHEIDEVGWAQISDSYGSAYSVAGLDGAPDENAGRVTTVSSAERTVAVAPLIAYGHGVRDRSDSTINVQLPAVTVGLARWFLVAVRRDWQANTTVIAALPDPQTSAVLPVQRLTNPGVQDDQPLALVQITGGQSIPTGIVDLRCWSGSAGLVGASDSVRLYLNSLGTQVTVGSKLWSRVLGESGSPVWVSHVHAAGDITSGTFDPDRIPGVPASKITSGVLPVARGGTGGGTAAAARTALGISTSVGGRRTGSTDANGSITFAHGLGRVPQRALVTMAGQPMGSGSEAIARLGDPIVWILEETSIVVRFRRVDTGDWFPSQPVAFYWEVS